MARDAFDSAYQPIVDVARGTVVGYEALARFPGFEERNPERWFAVAREHGCAAELEAAALRCALRQRRALPPNCFLTVNVSPDLLGTTPVRAVWRDAAGEGNGDLRGLVVELTEQAPIESYADLEADLDLLRSAGALIAVDDAGSGYAGLQHLVRLRPSLIKIDRALIQDVDLDETKRALVEMLGTFASRIDAWLLAEGIERAEELATLAALGVPLAQGYHLGRPGPPWVPIEPAVGLRLASAAHPHRTAEREFPGERTVEAALEVVPTVTDVTAAPGLFRGGAHLHAVVLIDERDRPLAVMESTVDLYAVAPGLRVNVHTPLSEALERAVTRPRAQRFEPLLVTDAAGRYLGIARMERLIMAVTTQVP
ncbi:hypothetical protein GCM10011512_08710 [Tersicoccus solisilvae]|uniref:EAL domain-containing protein n=1 Tax=Tersicoccus solisilvae TaxID=1882339 RepID=A0ABQ1NW48_9MICC|nr:EAL domain-containing protein [Tersicoccus solisilvae]GGC84152.1 hypothetical protein GCM10011512_08710 [Tersicoccus solisilvae]